MQGDVTTPEAITKDEATGENILSDDPSGTPPQALLLPRPAPLLRAPPHHPCRVATSPDTRAALRAAHGVVKFENGVTAYMLESSGAGMEVECICERGILRGLNNGESWCAILLSSVSSLASAASD